MSAAGRLATPAALHDFVRGGCATLTLVSTVSGHRFTYKVSVTRDNPQRFFVTWLRGPDNEADYQYLGLLTEDRWTGSFQWRLSYKPGAPKADAPVALAWHYFVQVLNHAHTRLPEQLEVWHEGRCARCGRKLTVPSSIESGFGPECVKYRGAA